MDFSNDFNSFIINDSIKKQYCELLKDLTTPQRKNVIVDVEKFSEIAQVASSEILNSDNFMFDLTPLFKIHEQCVDDYNNLLDKINKSTKIETNDYKKSKLDMSVKKFYPSEDLQKFINEINDDITQIETEITEIHKPFEY